MPINRLTPDITIDSYTEYLVKRTTRSVIRNLCYVGERCVNEARNAGTYIDRTGNLRSSTGYLVIVDGNIVQMSSFEQVNGGAQGSKDGQKFIRKITGEFPQGICLIVVAGMNYASYVSAKGYNVLDSSELLAERLVPKMLKQLGFKRK